MSACNALSYIDDVYKNLRKAQILNKNKFSAKRSQSNHINLQVALVKIDDLLNSSTIKIQTSLSYGKDSEQYMHLNTFQEKCMAIFSALIRSTPDTWEVIDKTITKQLNQAIDPGIREIERSFSDGAQLPAILKNTVYFNGIEKFIPSQLVSKAST